jgi:hypothetical protein
MQPLPGAAPPVPPPPRATRGSEKTFREPRGIETGGNLRAEAEENRHRRSERRATGNKHMLSHSPDPSYFAGALVPRVCVALLSASDLQPGQACLCLSDLPAKPASGAGGQTRRRAKQRRGMQGGHMVKQSCSSASLPCGLPVPFASCRALSFPLPV